MAGKYETKRKKKAHRRLGILLPLAVVVIAAIFFLSHDRTPNDSNWMLTLVNPWNPMEAGYVPELENIGDGHAVDARCADALLEMLESCRREGLSPVVCSSYRSERTQQSLFDDKVSRVMAETGCSEEDAVKEAAAVVAIPGTSEHQLGLAVDIVDASYLQLDEAQEQTAVQQWLMQHCHEYGFILRYPTGKRDLTGIIYEPWHYRYVGVAAAKEIHRRGICLEEYLAFR